MKSYEPNIVCDYVTVFIKDAENNPETDYDSGRCCWNIPYNAYYFKDRGSVCLMSIVDANMSKLSEMVVMTQKGFNGTTALVNDMDNDTRDLALLGTFIHNEFENSGDHYETEYLAPQKIKLLTPARPSFIKLYFFNINKDSIDFTDGVGAGGHITFKFEYVPPEILENNIVKQEYLPAF